MKWFCTLTVKKSNTKRLEFGMLYLQSQQADRIVKNCQKMTRRPSGIGDTELGLKVKRVLLQHDQRRHSTTCNCDFEGNIIKFSHIYSKVPDPSVLMSYRVHLKKIPFPVLRQISEDFRAIFLKHGTQYLPSGTLAHKKTCRCRSRSSNPDRT